MLEEIACICCEVSTYVYTYPYTCVDVTMVEILDQELHVVFIFVDIAFQRYAVDICLISIWELDLIVERINLDTRDGKGGALGDSEWWSMGVRHKEKKH